MPFKSGTVAIVGRPNVGKSTLLNALVGEKVAIVSAKPETTRSKILGILNRPEGQIVFVDTPGIHKPRILLGKAMVRLARSSLLEVDLVLCMVDASSGIVEDDRVLFDLIREDKPSCFLLLNKIDRIRKGRLLPLIDECRRVYPFREIIPVSALKADGLDGLVRCILAVLSEGPALFPAGEVTDKGPEFMISELIREAALEKTWEEVPHSIAVSIDELKDRSPKLTYVRATIYVERDSQRKILIGKKGEMLKAIGERAREEIQNYLGRRVYLDLWVKVLEHWRKDERALKRLGYA